MGRDGKAKPADYKSESKEADLKESRLLKEEPPKEGKKMRLERLAELMQEAEADKDAAQKLYEEAMLLVKEALEKAREAQDSIINEERFAEIVKEIINRLTSDSQVMLSLSNKESLKDNYLYAHSVNVCILAVKVGIGLCYDKIHLTELGIAALLHDIGMAKIPKEIVEKPGKLNAEEHSEVKQHCTCGVEILIKASDIGKAVVDSIQQHHERIDGSGYPKELKDTEISEYAKIIGLVDIYEALTHSRIYRKKKHSPDEAMKMLADLHGHSFKAQIAKVLIALIKEISLYPMGSIVELNTGEIGRVIRINKDFLSRPVVNIRVDPNGNKLKEVKEINLVEEPLLYIRRAIDNSEIDIKLSV